MNDDHPLPESDRVEGAPHPREARTLFGQDAAEATFLDAWAAGRMHHGWLITGARGVGKATLAWRIARFLLSTPGQGDDGLFGAPQPPATLDVPADHPVSHRISALAEPGLFLLRRVWDEKRRALKTVITVDEVRRLKSFFNLSATDGGRRVVIVDSADEMNPNAANALLKLLEEPPANAVLLLVAHQPSRLLPTIRSRCRELRLTTLGPDDMAAAMNAAGAETSQPQALAALSGGSVGEAIRLAQLDGLTLYAEIVALLSTLPRLDRPRALKLADSAAGKGSETRFDLILRLFDLFLSRLARTGIIGPPTPEATPGEAEVLARLCPDAHAARAWAQAAETLGSRARHGQAVNLDPASLILDMVLRIDQTAASLAARQAIQV